MNPTDAKNEAHQHDMPIFVDSVKYEVPTRPLTGQELRSITSVPADRDLWLEVHGHGDDILIKPENLYELKPGAHLYTAPSTINPGMS